MIRHVLGVIIFFLPFVALLCLAVAKLIKERGWEDVLLGLVLIVLTIACFVGGLWLMGA